MPMPTQSGSREAEEEYNPLVGARDRSGASGRADRVAARVFAQPKLGVGSLTASVRTGRPPQWTQLCQLTWWDFDQEGGAGPGRWFTTVSGDPPQLSLHPGDNARLASYLQQVVGPHVP